MEIRSGWLFWRIVYIARWLGIGELTCRGKEMEWSMPLVNSNKEALKELERKSRKEER